MSRTVQGARSPFLCSVDDVEPSIRRLLRHGLDVRDVASGVRLGDSDAEALFAEQEVGDETFLQLVAAELEQRRDAEG